jgi:hypothetical protein
MWLPLCSFVKSTKEMVNSLMTSRRFTINDRVKFIHLSLLCRSLQHSLSLGNGLFLLQIPHPCMRQKNSGSRAVT